MAAQATPICWKPGLSILIIDHDPEGLKVLSNALSRPGLEILTTANPEDGLELFRSRRPRIVLTDLVMERISGMELLDRIMEIDAATDVILMTAHSSAESAVEAIKNGANDYLDKPVSIGALNERVGKFLEKAHDRNHSLQLEDESPTHLSSKESSAAAHRFWKCSRASSGWLRTIARC